jgi:predicted phosphoadenosine phosphosulfate sulfurtransferase
MGMNKKRVYHKQNVYDASIDRLDFIFANFERIYLSFSGGKDSGVLLNLVLQYMKDRGIKKKIGIQILDNEANYEYSLDFMRRILDDNREYLEIYWCCLPITLPCTVSSYEIDWKCWGVRDEQRWVRPMPEQDYIVNIDNHPFGELFVEDMNYDHFWDMFAEWYSQGKSCANLIGIRTAESLNRFRAIMNAEKETMKGEMWTKKNTDHTYNCYPIYDWRTEDIWTANAKFAWDYNKLYDIFYMAGVPVHKMRVASPFMSESKSSLNMYRIIDSPVWARLCARVGGANFAATYGKQLNYHSFKLPNGHTWKTFTKFLIDTMPVESGANFKGRFVQSILFWGRTGRGLNDAVIADLDRLKIRYKINGTTPHGKNNLKRVVIKVPPDQLDDLAAHNSEVTSWKRFAVTILKNDHTCKYLGLAPTKGQMERQKEIQAKYGSVVKSGESHENHQNV